MAQKNYLLERRGILEIRRQRELIQFEKKIRHQEYIRVSSSLQGGLTTFLRQASESLQELPDMRNYTALFWESPHWQGSLFVHLASHIADKLLKSVKCQKSRTRRFQKIEQEKGVLCLFKSAFGRSEKKIILFVDNFHCLSEEKQQQFVSLVRQLHTYRGDSVYLQNLLFVIGGNLKWKSIDPNRTSPFSNAASKIELSDFNQAESGIFLEEFFAKKGLAIRKVVADYLFELTEGHPYFLQVFCKILTSQSSTPPSFAQVSAILHSLLEEGDDHLRNIRKALLSFSPEDLSPLVSILQGRVVKRSRMVPNPKIDQLLLLGLLKISPQSINILSLRNPIYSRFLRSDPSLRQKFFSTVAPTSWLTYPLVATNKEGYCLLNQLENRMRNFLVNQLYLYYGDDWIAQGLQGIRTDPERDRKTNKSVRMLKDVLELRKAKEEAHSPITAQENPLLSYATLLELRAMVIQNWKKIFRPFFGSQDQFMVYFTTLNRLRNKLAHNRLITEGELDKLGEILDDFRKWLGESF